MAFVAIADMKLWKENARIAKETILVHIITFVDCVAILLNGVEYVVKGDGAIAALKIMIQCFMMSLMMSLMSLIKEIFR